MLSGTRVESRLPSFARLITIENYIGAYHLPLVFMHHLGLFRQFDHVSSLLRHSSCFLRPPIAQFVPGKLPVLPPSPVILRAYRFSREVRHWHPSCLRDGLTNRIAFRSIVLANPRANPRGLFVIMLLRRRKLRSQGNQRAHRWEGTLPLYVFRREDTYIT